MTIVLNGTTGITNDGGYTGDGVVFADTTPANTLVTTTGGNVGIGTTSTPVRLSLVDSGTLGWPQSATETIPAIFRQTSSAATVVANGYKYSATSNGFASGYSSSWAKSAISLNEGTVRFYTDTAAAVAVGTDVTPTERARIDSSGNLLVGATTTDSGSRVRIVGASSTSADYALVVDRASGADILGCRNDGYVVVSSLAGSGNRAVYSDASGGLTNSSSDRNLKEDDREVTQGLTEVLAMRPVNFKWIDESRFGKQREIGFIAQEMLEIVPEVIGKNSDGSFSLDYPKLVPVLVKAIQEQQAIITALTARVSALEGTQNV